jgi:hypothetical protein
LSTVELNNCTKRQKRKKEKNRDPLILSKKDNPPLKAF